MVNMMHGTLIRLSRSSISEAVADPRNGLDELRIIQIVLQSLSQGVYIHIDLAPLPG